MVPQCKTADFEQNVQDTITNVRNDKPIIMTRY